MKCKEIKTTSEYKFPNFDEYQKSITKFWLSIERSRKEKPLKISKSVQKWWDNSVKEQCKLK